MSLLTPNSVSRNEEGGVSRGESAVLDPWVQQMQDCPRCGGPQIVVFAWEFEGGRVGCCLGCGILGLPLFRRGLQVWGWVMVAFNIVALMVEFVPTERAAVLDGWLTVIWIGLCIGLMMIGSGLLVAWHKKVFPARLGD